MGQNESRIESESKQQPRNGPCLGGLEGYYEDFKQIGEGGFGAIYLATRLCDNKKVVIKKIPMNNEFVEMVGIYPKEYVVMKQLDHPNIAKVYDIREDGEYFYIIMKYYKGGDLHKYLDEHEDISNEAILHIARQLISAIKYCHMNRIVHRDVKLENIFIKSDEEGLPNIVLADFGLANIASINTLLYSHIGSPVYAAPEFMEGIPYRGDKADIWAVGVVLYTLFTNEYPFYDEDIPELARQIMENEVFPDDKFGEMVTSECLKLIKWLLTKDPSKRPSIAKIEHHPCYDNQKSSSPRRSPVRKTMKYKPPSSRKPSRSAY